MIWDRLSVWLDRENSQKKKRKIIDEYVNPFCTKLDAIGSFQSYCIGHFEHEWLDALGQMVAEGRVPITDAPRGG